jgi:hypothetical protein
MDMKFCRYLRLLLLFSGLALLPASGARASEAANRHSAKLPRWRRPLERAPTGSNGIRFLPMW